MYTAVSLALFLILSVNGVKGLSCYCREAECEDEKAIKLRCKGGLVFDVCHCCKTCAKVEGERCGGLWGLYGECDQGLYCDREDANEFAMTAGICARKGHAYAAREGSGTEEPVKTTESTKQDEILPQEGSGTEEPEKTTNANGSGKDIVNIIMA